MQLLLGSSVSNNIIQHSRMKNGVGVSREIPCLKPEENPGVLHVHNLAEVHQSFLIVAALTVL